ncbi:MAG: sulfotransferase [Gammaproteobacteria bacterium]|nr:sulfotransferase [Gammaproteobacteria bacterium]
MLVLIVQTAGRWLQLARDGLASGGGAKVRFWRRFMVWLLLMPATAAMLLFHWSCLLLDEILFRGYRKMRIQAPVFITGVPRSGTTFVHRVLAADPQFTTFSTWECLFAPSVTQKKIIVAIAAVDARLGGLLKRLVDTITAAATRNLKDIHATRLDAPEEDYFVFMPLLLCFILVVAFPGAGFIWRMGFFDQAMSAEEKQRLMRYYRACLQKHIYVFGQDKTLLSKNASFASLVQSLAMEFPDARFVYCLRDPKETLPSQLSSLRDAMIACGNDPDSGFFRERMVELLSFYYRNLLDAMSQTKAGTRHSVLKMHALRGDLEAVIKTVYQQLGLTVCPAFESALKSEAEHSSRFRSKHSYSARQFGYDEKTIVQRFAHVYEHPDFQDFDLARDSGQAPAGQRLVGEAS